MSAEDGVAIVVVDEQPIVLGALASRLSSRGFVVQAALRTASELLEFVRNHTVDVVILGLPLREDGRVCLQELRATVPNLSVVVCNAPDEGEPAMAFAHGAAAFVGKSAHPDDIVATVRQTVARSIFLSAAKRRTARTTRDVDLTPREIEILVAATDGGTNAKIASRLWITEQTVKFHLSNIYRKLGVSNRTEMCRYALLHGLLAEDPRAASRPKRSTRS